MNRFRSLLPVLILAVAACSPRERVASHAGAPVILISIDTLRADHLPAYGYTRVETPALDAFRHDAILYRNAWSHCPMTLPSHVSILTMKNGLPDYAAHIEHLAAVKETIDDRFAT